MGEKGRKDRRREEQRNKGTERDGAHPPALGKLATITAVSR